MFDLIPDLFDLADNILIWAASGGAGFYAHKKISINYKERWKNAVQLLKDEKLQTENLELTVPKKKKPSGHFAPAGDSREFTHMQSEKRLMLESERLKNGLPPKDAMLNLHNYQDIAKERIRHGWDWDHEDNGWYWHETATHRQIQAKVDKAVEEAYNRGYSEARNSISDLYSRKYYSDHDHYINFEKYRRIKSRYW